MAWRVILIALLNISIFTRLADLEKPLPMRMQLRQAISNFCPKAGLTLLAQRPKVAAFSGAFYDKDPYFVA